MYSSSNELSQAIRETLAYSDIFDYPLTACEVHRYLAGRRTSFEAVQQALEDDKDLTHVEIYFAVPGRTEIVEIRKKREARSRKLLPLAMKYGRVLGSLPFVRMVALTGSLAVMNVSDGADFDYLLVAAPGRVWTVRAFALLFNRLTRGLGHTLCPNLILSETALEWSQRDLYSARELCQMIPITGPNVYHKLMQANEWIKEFLPNAQQTSAVSETSEVLRGVEFILGGKLGDIFERWEMNRKIARFSKQDGFGEETVFNAEMCQGNFDHHRKRTYELLRQRLNHLSRVSPLPVGEGLRARAS